MRSGCVQRRGRTSQGTNWVNLGAFAIFHLGAIAALFHFSWPAFGVAIFLFWMCTGLGISMGYHRLHTHRSYRVPLGLEYFFAVCGALTLEGGPIFWVATHRIHHQKSDQPGDPHSPRDGGWWSHMGWLLVGKSKHNDTPLMSKYAPDLAKHHFYVWLNDYHWVPMIVLGILLFALGGVPFVLWGIFLRVVVGLHTTWLVNSATHMWGSRRFATPDDSRNHWLIALITSGEGWHNNHHAYPTSARHGLAWYEFDLSWIQIMVLRFLGLAKHVQVARFHERPALRAPASEVQPGPAVAQAATDTPRLDCRSLSRWIETSLSEESLSRGETHVYASSPSHDSQAGLSWPHPCSR